MTLDPATALALPHIDHLLATDLEVEMLVRGDPEPHVARERRHIERLADDGALLFGGSSSLVVLRPLGWDTRHFGYPCADITRLYGANPPLEEILEHCRARGVKLLSARCRADRVDLVHALEGAGFRLVDTSVELGTALGEAPPSTARDARPEDRETLRRIARTFRANRFHLDERIDPGRADALYEAWVDRDQTIVVEEGGRVVGFCGWRRPDQADPAAVGTLTLIVIAPEGRGRGHFSSLVRGVRGRLLEAGARWMVTSTQVYNAAAHRAFFREGLRPYVARHVFHRWS